MNNKDSFMDFRLIFRALRHRNYRLFFGGQTISLVGTWMRPVDEFIHYGIIPEVASGIQSAARLEIFSKE